MAKATGAADIQTIEEALVSEVAGYEATLRRVEEEERRAADDLEERHAKVRRVGEWLKEEKDFSRADRKAREVARLKAVRDPIARKKIILLKPVPLPYAARTDYAETGAGLGAVAEVQSTVKASPDDLPFPAAINEARGTTSSTKDS